ncbi:hypothetical protein WJX72_002110 [[Myrmecia] bisecta]|uniref:Uncharacterized protein n=1 Tax=[Myrmecia] bisecta TaxID=41462 RepID=A0AAW1QEE0_9CHLO
MTTQPRKTICARASPARSPGSDATWTVPSLHLLTSLAAIPQDRAAPSDHGRHLWRTSVVEVEACHRASLSSTRAAAS